MAHGIRNHEPGEPWGLGVEAVVWTIEGLWRTATARKAVLLQQISISVNTNATTTALTPMSTCANRKEKIQRLYRLHGRKMDWKSRRHCEVSSTRDCHTTMGATATDFGGHSDHYFECNALQYFSLSLFNCSMLLCLSSATVILIQLSTFVPRTSMCPCRSGRTNSPRDACACHARIRKIY